MNITELKKRYDEFVESCGEGIVPEISEYVQALEDATHWRDVREELPEYEGRYYCILNGRVEILYFSIGGSCDGWHYKGQTEPTHWQPLPAWPEVK